MFAHRGASAHAPENTLDAFRLALKLGATGLETDCWVTRDRQVVLDHDGVVKPKNTKFGIPLRLKNKKISQLEFDEIPGEIPKIELLIELAANNYPISIDVCDPDAIELIADIVTEASAQQKIYLCHPDIELLRESKLKFPNFKYVNSIRLSKMSEGPERRCANLAKFGVDVLNMHHTDWNGGLVALAHRFEIAAFSWDLQHTEQLQDAFLMGVDAVYSDWSDRMVDARNQIFKT